MNFHRIVSHVLRMLYKLLACLRQLITYIGEVASENTGRGDRLKCI